MTPIERAAGVAYLTALGTRPIHQLDADLDRATGSFEASTRVLAILQTERGVAMALHPSMSCQGRDARHGAPGPVRRSLLPVPLGSSSDGRESVVALPLSDRWLLRVCGAWLGLVAFVVLVGAVKGAVG